MTNTDKAIEILSRTKDGDELSPVELRLTEAAVNNRLVPVGQEAFDELHRQVMAGDFVPIDQRSLFGLSHLTRDASGYVYWKGRRIEHYSHSDVEAMQRDAEKLAARCRALEEKGFPVTGRTATEEIFEQAPADTPWLQALQKYYSFFQGFGRYVAILYREGADDVIVLERETTSGEVKKQVLSGAYEAFHFVQDQGLRSISPITDYDTFKAFFESAHLTPDDVREAVAA